MAVNKPYWYMRLKDDFFRDERIIDLKTEEYGYEAIVILLEIRLLSINAEGVVIKPDGEPYTMKKLAKVIGEESAVLESALKLLSKNKLLDVEENGIIRWNHAEFVTCVGKGSSEGDRQKLRRENDDKEVDKCTPEEVNDCKPYKEDISKDKEKEKPKKKKPSADLDELEANFNKIYELYPKKGSGKQSAFAAYKSYVTNGRKINGRNVKLTNRQIWFAVKNYVNQKELSGTELKFYKNFSTLMNNICDYLVEEKTEDGTGSIV